MLDGPPFTFCQTTLLLLAMRKPKSVVKRPNSQMRVAIAFVIVATLFGLIASGLKAADDNTYQALHSLALFVMLLAYIFFISTILSLKNESVSPLELSVSPKPPDQNISFLDMNCLLDQILHIDDSIGDWNTYAPMSHESSISASGEMEPDASTDKPTDRQIFNVDQAISLMSLANKRDRSKIRAVIVRDTPINFKLMKFLGSFPNLSVLDLQNCSIAEDVWHEFVHFDHLTDILAFGAISKDDYRQLAYVLPEIHFWMEPYCLRTHGVNS